MVARIKEVLEKYKFRMLLTAGVGISVDTLFFEFNSDLVILFLTGLWILSLWLYEYEGRISIGMGLGFLILCPFLLIFKAEAVAEKAAIWAYVFLVVGVIQQIVEYRRSEE